MTLSNSDQQELLARNGFLVTASPHKPVGMAEAYSLLRDRRLPIFVTTDMLLHTAHLFFDGLLRIVEWTALRPHLVALTETLLSAAADDVTRAHDRRVQEAARRNLAFFAVGARLLDPSHPTPIQVRRLVEAQLAQIEGAQTSNPPPHSPVLGIREDYSQYIPRGHYTRNEEFRTYFLATMWYSRMAFLVYPSQSHALSEEDTERLARQALLITRALHRERVGDRPAIEVWRDLYEISGLFVGRAEDPGPHEYATLAQVVYGGLPDLDALVDESKLSTFLAQARELPRPRVLSAYYLSRKQPDAVTPRWQDGTLGFRLLPQCFVPDTHMFNELVWDRVGNYTGPDSPESGSPFTLFRSPYDGPYRALPRGLDVLAAFGSELAERILDEEGDTEYDGYRERLAELRALYAQDHNPDDLYRRWLDVLRALLVAPPENASEKTVPPLFRSEAWARKQLNAALGAWTELRHDTLLYVQQSVSSVSLGGPPRPPPAYLEPYPLVYRRLGALVAQLREQLDQRGLLAPVLRDRIVGFETLLGELRAVAADELNGQWPDQQYAQRLVNIGDWLKAVIAFPAALMEETRSSTGDRMALVADVHTHIEGGLVLEEAVGTPDLIIVEWEHGGQRVRYWGAVFSYYEFKHPIDDRLTDEAWQTMSPKPARPPWTHAFSRA